MDNQEYENNRKVWRDTQNRLVSRNVTRPRLNEIFREFIKDHPVAPHELIINYRGELVEPNNG